MHEASYTLEAFARTLVYIPALLVVGAVSFRLWYPEHSGTRFTRKVFLASAALALAVLFRAAAHAHAAFGEEAFTWESLRLVAIESRWGSRWRWQFLSAVLAAFSLGMALVRDKIGWVLAGAAALGLCASLPLTGHAMALGTLAVVSQTAHVLGAGIWIGTLGIAKLIAAVDDDDGESYRRFAPLAATGVALLLASGGVTAWQALGSLEAIGRSAYGRLLLIKMTAVAAALLCGFLNWRRFRSETPGREWVTRELLFAAVVLAVTGWLSETGTPEA